MAEAAANALFAAELAPFEHVARRSITARLQQYPFDALVILAFTWNKFQGKVMKGLDNRRAAEWRIYTGADHSRW